MGQWQDDDGGVLSVNGQTGVVVLAFDAAGAAASAQAAALQKTANLGDVASAGAARRNINVPQLPAARCIATANVALAGLQTIDGIALGDGDVVLLTGQTTASQNGTWLAHAGAWTRPTDFVSGSTVKALAIDIVSGTTHARESWLLQTNVSITIDTTAQVWLQRLPASVAPTDSPTFTGDPKAPTPAAGDNDTSIATTAYVNAVDPATDGLLNGLTIGAAWLPSVNSGISAGRLYGLRLRTGRLAVTISGLAWLVRVGATVDDGVVVGLMSATATPALIAKSAITSGLLNSAGVKYLPFATPATINPSTTVYMCILCPTVGGTAATAAFTGADASTISIAALYSTTPPDLLAWAKASQTDIPATVTIIGAGDIRAPLVVPRFS